MRTPGHAAIVLILAAAACVAIPDTAHAQRRRAVRVLPSRPVVIAGAFEPLWFDPWFPGPYGYGVYPPYGIHPVDIRSSVRLQVTPRQTEVYVDGAFAGLVDDFDGIFQRLHVLPGQHEVVLYLDNHRTEYQNLYLAPGSGYNIRHSMQPLLPGEPQDPRPSVAPAPPPGAGRIPIEREAPPAAAGRRATRFGTLLIRVQPSGADILIDGELWEGPEGSERLAVQVPEGRRVVEIRRTGYRGFSTEVEVRGGESVPLNVSLTPE